jgi:curved DNA-binding protein CbpA
MKSVRIAAKTLGLSEGATLAQTRAKYYHLAKLHHPDAHSAS